MKVTKETNIAELLTKHPQTAEAFVEYGLHCVGCMAAAFDSIGQGATSHGIDEESINTLIEDLNLVVNEGAETEKTDGSGPAKNSSND